MKNRTEQCKVASWCCLHLGRSTWTDCSYKHCCPSVTTLLVRQMLTMLWLTFCFIIHNKFSSLKLIQVSLYWLKQVHYHKLYHIPPIQPSSNCYLMSIIKYETYSHATSDWEWFILYRLLEENKPFSYLFKNVLTTLRSLTSASVSSI